MASLIDVPLDSAEGIAIMFKWARAHGVALSGYHEKIAVKYGVDTKGVTISRPLPRV